MSPRMRAKQSVESGESRSRSASTGDREARVAIACETNGRSHWVEASTVGRFPAATPSRATRANAQAKKAAAS
eukprot:611730-Prymnesium_polylepis.1